MRNIAIAAFLLCFLLLLGIAGGLEAGNFTIETALLLTALDFAAMVASVKIGKLR